MSIRRGSIRQRKLASGRTVWDVVVDVGSGHNGKRRQQRKRGFSTKAEARRELTAIQSAVDTASYVPADRVTVKEHLTKWAAGVQVRPSTRSSYATHVAIHLVPRLGHLRLQELDGSAIQDAYAGMIDAGLSATTVRRVHATLHRALRDAAKRKLVVRNVAGGGQIELPKQVRPEMRTWTGPELRRFLDHVRDERLFPAYLLSATTGMRRGEVLGLRWRDTDLDAGRAAVTQALIAVHHALSFVEPKTRRSRRLIPLPLEAIAALRAHRKHQLEERLAWGPAYEDTDLVFTWEDGSPVHPDRFSKSFEQYARAAGVPPIRLHDVRHTFATLALQAGVPPKVVADILGHASVAFTMDVYSHAIPSMQEDAVAKVAGLVFGGVSG